MKDHLKKGILWLCVLALTMGMTACSGSTPATTAAQTEESKETLPDKPETTAEAATTQAAETTTEAAPTTEAAQTTAEETTVPESQPAMPYEKICGEYFQHGGDWTTMLTVNADGSFNGDFSAHYFQDEKHHYDVGEFHGTFTDAKQIDDLTWTIRVDSLTVDGEVGKEWEQDGETYTCIGDPTAPVPGTELTVYLPGSDSARIPEEFFTWIRSSAEAMPKLEGTALVNDTEGVLSFYYLPPEEN